MINDCFDLFSKIFDEMMKYSKLKPCVGKIMGLVYRFVVKSFINLFIILFKYSLESVCNYHEQRNTL